MFELFKKKKKKKVRYELIPNNTSKILELDKITYKITCVDGEVYDFVCEKTVFMEDMNISQDKLKALCNSCYFSDLWEGYPRTNNKIDYRDLDHVSLWDENDLLIGKIKAIRVDVISREVTKKEIKGFDIIQVEVD